MIFTIRIAISFLFSIISFYYIQAQHCATAPNYEWFEEKEALGGRPYLNSPKIIPRNGIIIPVRYYIIQESNGQNGLLLKDLIQMHCDLNTNFQPVGFQFVIDSIIYIKNSSYYNMTTDAQITNLSNAYASINHCNIFIANQVKPGACGFTYMPRRSNSNKEEQYCIFLVGSKSNTSCIESGSITLTHEMGHWLDLPHTFFWWEGGTPPNFRRDRVDRLNCSFTGDGFCDTDPDYEASRWPCPNNNGKIYTDPTGQTFTLKAGNFMSYSNDACANMFSPLQIQHMNSIMNQYPQRIKFKNYNGPSLIELGAKGKYFPENPPATPANIRYSKQNIQIRFNPIENVYKYHFVLARGNANLVSNYTFPSNAVLIDTFIYDTFLTISPSYFLSVDNNFYYWKLTPISRNDCCGKEGSGIRYFKVTDINPAIEVVDNNCYGEELGEIKITKDPGNTKVITNITDLDLKKLDAKQFNLKSGFYPVYIYFGTGSSQEVIRRDIEIKSPEEIKAELAATDKVAEIKTITGGVPSYSYLWSNGKTTKKIDANPDTEYFVEITDNNNCTKEFKIKTKKSSSIHSLQDKEIKIYPTILNNQKILTIEGLSELDSYLFSLSSTDGKNIYSHTDKGSKIMLQLPDNLAPGIYFLSIMCNGIELNKKIIVR